MMTPESFLDAIAEGNEPTATDKATVDAQIRDHSIKVFVFNSQNSTPDVQRLVDAARREHIPVATVTETLTPDERDVPGLAGARAAGAARGTRQAASDARERRTGERALVPRRRASTSAAAPIWRDVDLEIPEREFVAILGPNGVGKSTLLNAILGLVPLDARARSDVLGRPPGASNHEIGYLPQRRSFDPSVRIRGIDIVRLGLDGDRYGIPLPGARSRRDRQRVDELDRSRRRARVRAAPDRAVLGRRAAAAADRAGARAPAAAAAARRAARQPRPPEPGRRRRARRRGSAGART